MARAFNVMKDGDKERSLDIHDYLIRHPDATFFLKMEADGPEGSGIEEGDVLVVDRSLSPKRGSLIVATIDGDLNVEVFSREEEQVLWGVVIGLLRRLS